MTTIFSACSIFGGDQTPAGPETQTISPEGGILTFSNGIQLIVPPNTVGKETNIQLRTLSNNEVNPLLEEGKIPVDPLIFFEVLPDDFEFTGPIEVVLPVKADKLRGWPIHIRIDSESNTVEYMPTKLVYDPEAGSVRFSLDHFSTNGVGAVPDEDFPNECDNPTTACRCGRIFVKSSFHDYSIGECQSVSDEVSVQFLDCPGQPTESHRVSEISGECLGMGSIKFQPVVFIEGHKLTVNCDNPIPFIIGENGSILGGGPMQCSLQDNIGGIEIDMFVDEQINLTGKLDAGELKFDPPQAENITGYLKSWTVIQGEKFTVIDMNFDDEQASATVGEFMGMTMMSFTTPAEGDEETHDQFAFKLPMEDGAVTELTFQDDGASAILTITLDLY